MAFFRGLAAVSRLRSRVTQEATTLGGVRWLQMQSASDLDLRSQLQELIPEQQDRLKKLKSEHGKVQLGNITVDMVLGGMRGMTGMLWETSLLDAEEGIRFRGLSIPECQKVLPAAVKDGEPLPEGLLWLLLTGKVPTKEQVDALSKELLSRSNVPGPLLSLLANCIIVCSINTHVVDAFVGKTYQRRRRTAAATTSAGGTGHAPDSATVTEPVTALVSAANSSTVPNRLL